MQLLLGYIGLVNMVLLSPIALWQAVGNSQLTFIVVSFLVVKGLFDNVLSDYLWLRAVMLTSATVATVGLGLTIPLAFASDVLLKKGNVFSSASVMGALSVLAGFVMVNVGNGSPSSAVTSRGRDTEYRDFPTEDDDEEEVQLRNMD